MRKELKERLDTVEIMIIRGEKSDKIFSLFNEEEQKDPDLMYKVYRKIKSGESLRKKLERQKREVLKRRCKTPEHRVNIYVHGDNIEGTAFFCGIISYFLCPEVKERRNLIYKNTTMREFVKDYIDQSIVIWDRVEGKSLLRMLKDSHTFTELFEPHPYLSPNDFNHVFNIVNATEEFNTFVENISRDTVIQRVYRRLPIYIYLNDNKLTTYITDHAIFESEERDLDFSRYIKTLEVPFYWDKFLSMNKVKEMQLEVRNTGILDEIAKVIGYVTTNKIDHYQDNTNYRDMCIGCLE